MLDLNYMSKNEKDIYATGLVVGYIIGMNKGTLEELDANGYIAQKELNWIVDVRKKIQDIESTLPEVIDYTMAEKMFNEFADKVRGN